MEERQVFELPGAGEVRARVGTSTHELAGAVKFWHDKYGHAWRDGFVSACVVFGLAGGIAEIIHLLL